MKEKIKITNPELPELDAFIPYLSKIWNSRFLTNNGPILQEFESELKTYLQVDYLSVVSSGTMALMLALKASGLKGEVITTPFSFAATTNAITWLGLNPIFIDINPIDFNIDESKIENAITSETSAILPVHIYGLPSNIDKIEAIAKKHNLKVIYDAAHCFNEKINGQSILKSGDFSAVSFHATKSFNTLEGGAIVSRTAELKNKIDSLINFGFENNGDDIKYAGINGKLNEVQAALGILQLKKFEKNRLRRKDIFEYYLKKLKNVNGIYIPNSRFNIERNYGFFPLIVKDNFHINRDLLYSKLIDSGIIAKKYFCPLISNLSAYKDLNSSNKSNLKIANQIQDQIICLPIYSDLTYKDVDYIISQILET